jgi:hypothetical protein
MMLLRLLAQAAGRSHDALSTCTERAVTGARPTVSGTTDWARYEITFYLKRGQRPDLIKLNLAVEGVGKVWLRNIELLQTPLSA